MKKIWSNYSYAILLILLSCGSALFISYQTQSFHKEDYVKITINEGDSLWKIADQYSGKTSLNHDTFITWVKKNNQLEENTIYPGEEIVIPIKSHQHSLEKEFASAK